VNELDLERLVGSVLKGVLGGRRKRSRGALRYLTHGNSSLLNAGTLMTLAGVAWGLWETANASTTVATPASGAPRPAAPTAGTPSTVVPPPLPPSAAPSQVVPPPLPPELQNTATAPAPPPEIVRVLRLTLSAARADGTLAASEREAILAQARAVGAEAVVRPELDAPRPLAEILAGATDPQLRRDLYTLAFTIVRADEQVNETERTYLNELAGHLGLEATVVADLEQRAASRIQAAAEGAQ
jgi:uncharacterized membrane protein YebE (DUF533 family)